jgi:lipopolysaccharide/colanic/teichoic acid biosynthesis glycosyltransferase
LQLERANKAVFERNGCYRLVGKRLLDLLITIPALILLIPFFLVVAVIIKLDSSGSVIYKQKRVGKNAKEFYIYKFRTMVANADKLGPSSTKDDDNRITKVGKILRSLSIDELPQLINVLLGQMSIVGYRPGVLGNYSDSDLNSKIFSVKPGITGYAQVNGRSALTLEEKRYWENKYVEDISFLTDIKILLKTIAIVLNKRGVN